MTSRANRAPRVTGPDGAAAFYAGWRRTFGTALAAFLDAVPVLAFVMATTLVFWKPFWMDETYTAAAVESASVAEMIRHWIGNDVHPPLYYLLDYALVRGFGRSELVLRLPSLVAFGCALVLLRFRSRRVIGNDAARLATAVFASAFFVLSHAFEARSYLLVMFFAIWATLAFLEMRTAPDRCAAVHFVVAALLMSLTHYFGALFAGTLFVVLFARALGDRRRLPLLLIGGAVYAVVLLPWLGWHASALVQIGRGGFWIIPVPLWYGAMVAALSCWGGLYGPLWALPSFASLLTRQGRVDWRDDPAIDLLAAIILAVAVTLVVSLRVPVIVPRYFSPLLAGCMVAGGMLVARFRSPLREAVATIMCLASLTQAVPALSVMPYPMRALFDPSPFSLAWRGASERIMAAGARRVLFVYDGPFIPSFDAHNVAAMGGTFFRHANYAVEMVGRTTTPDGRLPLEPLPAGAFAVLKIVNDVRGYPLHPGWTERLLATRRGRCEPPRVGEPQICFIEAARPR